MYDIDDVLDRALARHPISKEECISLMSFPESSAEAGKIIGKATDYALERTDGVGRIGVQIGVMTGPCYANCDFCVFAYTDLLMEQYVMSESELSSYLKAIMGFGTVSSVSLMTIADFDFDVFLDRVKTARSMLPDTVDLVTNTGDLSFQEALELKAAGVNAVYHALRLGEGIVNMLEPLDRFQTMKNVKEVGLRLATGVEPIGPEHTPEEICDAYFNTIGFGCDCCSASAREPVYGTRLYSAGAISSRRLSQIRSSLLLASTSMNKTPLGYYGGYYGGFDRVLSEYAGSPKDLNEVSENGLGRTVPWAEGILKERGYDKVLCSDGSVRRL